MYQKVNIILRISICIFDFSRFARSSGFQTLLEMIGSNHTSLIEDNLSQFMVHIRKVNLSIKFFTIHVLEGKHNPQNFNLYFLFFNIVICKIIRLSNVILTFVFGSFSIFGKTICNVNTNLIGSKKDAPAIKIRCTIIRRISRSFCARLLLYSLENPSKNSTREY